MPYALCPMPYARRVPHLSEKGYISVLIVLMKQAKKSYQNESIRVTIAAIQPTEMSQPHK
jgi:hypothetical protein